MAQKLTTIAKPKYGHWPETGLVQLGEPDDSSYRPQEVFLDGVVVGKIITLDHYVPYRGIKTRKAWSYYIEPGRQSRITCDTRVKAVAAVLRDHAVGATQQEKLHSSIPLPPEPARAKFKVGQPVVNAEGTVGIVTEEARTSGPDAGQLTIMFVGASRAVSVPGDSLSPVTLTAELAA